MEKNKKMVPELRFKEFDEDWIHQKLNQVCEKIQDGNYGGDYPKSDEFVSEGIPFLTSKALGGDGQTEESKIDYITKIKHRQLKKAHLKLYDVLFTNRGSNVGVIGFVDERIANGNIGPQLTLLRSNSKIESKFLYHTMVTPLMRKQIKAQDSGSAMNFFGIKDTGKFKLSLPTLPEQQKIASFLTAVDSKIQQLTRKKELLEQYKKGVMQQLFKQELRFKPALSEVEGDEQGNDYPEWEEKKLGEVCSKVSSGKDKALDEGTYSVYGSTGIIGYCNNASFDGQYILIARVGANAGQINLVNGEFGVTDNTLVVQHNKEIDTVFLSYFLYQFNLNRLIFGSGQPLITGGLLKSIKFFVPNLNEQQKIASFLSSIDQKIVQVGVQLEKAREWKKGLLQKMFV